MNHFIEVKEISISDFAEACKNKNYPSSGFYIVRTDNTSDLRFVDKSMATNICICPESVYDGLECSVKELPQKPTSMNDEVPPAGFVSEDFVVSFTKLLLSNKKQSL